MSMQNALLYIAQFFGPTGMTRSPLPYRHHHMHLMRLLTLFEAELSIIDDISRVSERILSNAYPKLSPILTYIKLYHKGNTYASAMRY